MSTYGSTTFKLTILFCIESSAINNVLLPRKGFLQTKTFDDILKKVKDKTKLILHCYGVAGSGKSELIRSLAKKFPYCDTKALPIKWHIRCNNKENELKKEFSKLAKNLQNSDYIPKEMDLTSLKEDLESHQPKRLVEILLNCKAPVLIIIEDSTEKESELLQSFFTILNEKYQGTKHSKFHIYATSRSNTSSSECHELFNVVGFNENESVHFLQETKHKTEDKREDLILVHQRFSGLPLGLLAAKCFCKNAGLTYEEYLELANDPSSDLQSDEKEALQKEYGSSTAVEHIFQAIVMPFFPKDETLNENKSTNLFRKILCCISYFHFDGIPRFLLDYCCHIVWDTSRVFTNVKLKNKVETGKLITCLLNYGMCTKTEDGDITFHEVVLTAFRVKHQAAKDFNPLKKAIETMCGLVSLDLRINLNRMRKLRPHLESLLKHIEKNIEVLKKDKEFKKVTQAVMSHLYQILGAVLVDESSPKEEIDVVYGKSFESIWPEMTDVLSLPEKNTSDNFSADATAIADEITKKSAEKSRLLPADFVIKYSSLIISHFAEQHDGDFFRSKTKGRFEKVQKLFKALGSKIELVEELQKCELFLPDEVFSPIFYAERFASIMHSWSRHYLFSTSDQAMENCLWMNSLSVAVSSSVKNSLDIPLLAEWLSKLNGLIPLLLKQKNRPESLKRAEELCKDMIKDRNLEMYEYGLIKKAFSPTILPHISLLRYIVRINTRMVLNEARNEEFLLQADKQCEELFELVSSNVHVVNRLAYIIYCGKYNAAKGDFAEALNYFKNFFKKSLEPKLKPRFYNECWAVYNYARAACCDSTIEDKRDAMRRCKDVLGSKKFIPEDLKKHLEEEHSKLKSLT